MRSMDSRGWFLSPRRGLTSVRRQIGQGLAKVAHEVSGLVVEHQLLVSELPRLDRTQESPKSY